MMPEKPAIAIIVYTMDGQQTTHSFAIPDSAEAVKEQIQEHMATILPSFDGPTKGRLFAFFHPNVLYNPAQVSRIEIRAVGLTGDQPEIAGILRQVGFLQDQPGRGRVNTEPNRDAQLPSISSS